MTEDEQKAADVAKKNVDNDLTTATPERLREIVLETRSEAKQRRLKEQELSEELETLRAEKAKQEQDKKLAEGKDKEVIVDLTKQVDDWRTKYLQIKTEYEIYETSENDQIKKIMGESWTDSLLKLSLAERKKLASKFTPGESLLDSDNGSKKKGSLTKIEGLKKDYQLAEQRKDLKAQLAISRLIDEEEKRTKGQ